VCVPEEPRDDHCKRQADDEQNPNGLNGDTCDSGNTEHYGEHSNDEKSRGPTHHVRFSAEKAAPVELRSPFEPAPIPLR
jgi:hypothetical protein